MKRLKGYAVRYESFSEDLGGFKEVIQSSAMKEVVSRSDVLCLCNHDLSQGLLGRCTKGQGSMTLTSDSQGLMFQVTPPSSAAALIESVERRDMVGCSFAFTLQKDGDYFQKLPNGTILRTITQIDQLFDCSIVARPAYLSTSIEVV